MGKSVSTLDDLMKLHDSPVNQIVILEPSLDATDPVVANLQELPNVSQVLARTALCRQDQDQKLPLIEKAAKYILPLFEPNRRLTPATPRKKSRR